MRQKRELKAWLRSSECVFIQLLRFAWSLRSINFLQTTNILYIRRIDRKTSIQSTEIASANSVLRMYNISSCLSVKSRVFSQCLPIIFHQLNSEKGLRFRWSQDDDVLVLHIYPAQVKLIHSFSIIICLFYMFSFNTSHHYQSIMELQAAAHAEVSIYCRVIYIYTHLQ